MKDILLRKNIFCESALMKYSMNYKYTDLYPKQKSITIKSFDRNKKICDDISSINKSMLKKEFSICLQEPLEDVANLIVQNDNEFKISRKEKKGVLTTTNKILEATNSNKYIDAINIREANETGVNEIIEIKCTQRQADINYQITDAIQYHDKIENDPNDTGVKTLSSPQNNLKCTNDIKSDLQSILMLMAMSNTYYDTDSDKSIHTNSLSVQNEDYIKSQNVKVEPLQNTSNEINDLLKIAPLKTAVSKENKILRKYANKWVDYVQKRRENIIHQQRLTTIGNFFDRLEKRKLSVNHTTEAANKAKIHARDYSTYHHRYKVQKHIIALQKAKLEQQNRLIEELKYNKIIKDSRQSLDYMKDDIRQTYYEIDKHLKPKIKCLTNELKIRDIEESSLVLHCLKVPQFLQRMEARAREREEKHAMIRERRKQMEEERIRLKQQAELAKAEMDKEEKNKRIKELREKRRKEKIENIRKKQHAERLRALLVMADLHYEKSLTVKYGIRPLKLLIELKRDNIEKAKAHHHFQLKKNVFLHWMWHTEDMWYERNFKADDFYRKKILRMTFSCLKKNHYNYLLKKQVATDYYDLYVTQLVFKKFQEGIVILKKEFNIKWNTAIIYFNSNLRFKTLTCWRTLPALSALKREQDARKLRWREKVLQVVPDYVPPED